MKKLNYVIGLLISMITFVSASNHGFGGNLASGLGYGVAQLIDIVGSIISPIGILFFGGDSGLMFEKVLLLAIIVSIVYVIISNMEPFKGSDSIVWIITISVSLLTTRFMTEQMVNAIILPYSVLGVSLTAILPLMIYFTFVQSFKGSATIRKTLWLFFMVVFIGIWASRDDIGDLSWIYFFTALAALVFFLFDGTIRRYMLRQQFGEMDLERRSTVIAKLQKEMTKLETDKKHYPEHIYKRMKKRMLKQIEDLRKH